MNLVDNKVKHDNMDEAWHVVWNDVRGTIRNKIVAKIWRPVHETVVNEVKINIETVLDKV